MQCCLTGLDKKFAHSIGHDFDTSRRWSWFRDDVNATLC